MPLAGELFVTITAKTEGLDAGVAKAQKTVQDFADKSAAEMAAFGKKVSAQATQTGRAMTMGLTLPIVAAAAEASKMAADFGDAMAKVEGAAGAGHAEVEALRGKVLALSEATGKGPKDLADGLYFVESMGYRGAAAMDILAKSARLSAGGMGSTADIAQTVTFAINAYGKENLTAAKAADVMAAAVREGAMAPDAMAGAIGRVLPEAARMGIGFDKLTGSLAAMTRIGLNVDEAVTAIRQTMLTLDHPSAQTKKALGSVGLTAEEVSASLKRDFIGTLGVLAKASEKGGEAFQHMFPNVRAFTGVLALTGKQSAEVASLIDRVTNSTGSADKIFDVASKTSGFAFRQALQAITVAGIHLGDTLAPTLKAIAADAVTLADDWSKLSPEMKDTVVRVLEVVAVLGPLSLAFGKVATSIRAVIELRTAYQSAMTAYKAASAAAAGSEGIGAITVAAGAATTAVAALIAALSVGVLAGKAFSDAYSNYDDRMAKDLAKHGFESPIQRALRVHKEDPGFDVRLDLTDSDYSKYQAILKAQDAAYDAGEKRRYALSKGPGRMAATPTIPPLRLGASINPEKNHKGKSDGEKESDAYKSALDSLKTSIANVGNATEAHKAAVSRLWGEYAKLTPVHYATILANAKELDQLNAGQKAREAYTSTLAGLRDKIANFGVTTAVGALKAKELRGGLEGVSVALKANLYAAAATADHLEAIAKAAEVTKAMTQKLASALHDATQAHLKLVATNDLDRTSIDLLGKSYDKISSGWNRVWVLALELQEKKNEADQKTIDNAKALTDSYNSLLAEKVKELGLMRTKTELEKLNWELTYGALKNATSGMKTWLVAVQSAIDANQKLLTQSEAMKAAWKEIFAAAAKAAEASQEKVKEATARIADTLIDGLDKIQHKGFKGMFTFVSRGFDQMLKEMAQAWLKSEIMALLLNAGTTGGKLGGGGNIIGQILGGIGSMTPHRAAGGPVMGGMSYLVGENGPELFTPPSGGNITRNSDLRGGGTTQHFHTTIQIHPPTDSDMSMQAASEHASSIGRMVNQQLRRNSGR